MSVGWSAALRCLLGASCSTASECLVNVQWSCMRNHAQIFVTYVQWGSRAGPIFVVNDQWGEWLVLIFVTTAGI